MHSNDVQYVYLHNQRNYIIVLQMYLALRGNLWIFF